MAKSGFKNWEREIEVGAGDSISLNAELEVAPQQKNSAPPIPATGAPSNPPSPTPTSALVSISLDSKPSGAAVSLDGRLAGETPLRIRLDAGSHVLTVRKQGYRPWVQNIEIPPGGSMEIMADLQVGAEQAPAPDVIHVPPQRSRKSDKK